MFFYQFCFDYLTEALVVPKGRVFNFSRLKVCFSRVAFCCDFHGKKICFTGCFKDFFTGWIQFSREQNRFFSRVTKKFSRGKKKHCVVEGVIYYSFENLILMAKYCQNDVYSSAN